MHAQVHLHGIGTQSRRGQGGSRPSKNEKNECFQTKTDAIREKINQTNFICAEHILLHDYTHYSRN